MKSLCWSCKSGLIPGACIETNRAMKVSEEGQHVIECDKYNKKIIIEDSGNRTEFDTGAVRDIHIGKGRYDLLPWNAIDELAKHCENGAIKYGERNCEKGIPMHSFLDSASRHISSYMRGMKNEPHLRAALWNIAMAIETELLHPELNDIPNRLDND